MQVDNSDENNFADAYYIILKKQKDDQFKIFFPKKIPCLV